MIVLLDNQTGAEVGTITPEQLRFLQAQLEEESASDQDYYINEATLDMFERRGADADLLSTIRTALGGRSEMEIRWVER